MQTDDRQPPHPEYQNDLERLRQAFETLRGLAASVPGAVDALCLNPTLMIMELPWQGLAALLHEDSGAEAPVKGPEHVLLWIHPSDRAPRARPAASEDLLVLKMVAESIPAGDVAAAGRLPIGAVDAAVDRAVRNGLLLAPPSRLRRDPSVFTAARPADAEYLSTPSFTLQWHITQVCDLHCRHCYDRSDRSPLSYDEGVRVLDDLRAFCRERNVQGAVSFTGGNPLLHPRFDDIYRAAVDRNFSTAILGNRRRRSALPASSISPCPPSSR